MSGQAPVIINKPKSMWHSFFWAASAAIVAVVVCGTIVSIAAIDAISQKFDVTTSWVNNLAENLQGWQNALPPALADAIDDQRAIDYARNVEVTCKVEDTASNSRSGRVMVVTVKNNGDKVISLAALHVTGLDSRGVPVWEQTNYAATPLALDARDEWRGPLWPGKTRVFSLEVYPYPHRMIETANAEIVELRTWAGPHSPTTRPADSERVKPVQKLN